MRGAHSHKIKTETARETRTLKDAIDKTEEKERHTSGLPAKTEEKRFAPIFDFGTLMNADTTALDPEQQAAGYHMIGVIEEVASVRKEQFRQGIFASCEKNGIADERGSLRFTVNGTKLGKRKNVGTKPDEEGLKQLLRSKGISLTEGFDEVTVYSYNPSKVDFLVESGKLTRSEVDALRKVTYTIECEASDELAKYVSEARGKFAMLPPKKSRK